MVELALVIVLVEVEKVKLKRLFTKFKAGVKFVELYAPSLSLHRFNLMAMH